MNSIGNTLALWADVGIDRTIGLMDHSDDLVPEFGSPPGHHDDAATAGALAPARASRVAGYPR